MSELLHPDELRAVQLLYVDDEAENLFGFQAALRRKFRILTALSGREALAILSREPVGVVVTDQRMPEMTGVELIRHAKDLYPDTVFLILTAYSDFDAMVDGINTGALSGFISKPWDRGEVELILQGAVERHLLARHLRRRTEELAQLNSALENKVRERTAALDATVARLNEANTQLAALNRLKDEFISFCSHDLKSPLTAMGSFLDLLEFRLERRVDPEVLREIIASMRQVVGDMESLVTKISDTSRLSSGREMLRLEVAPLDATLRAALPALEALARSKGLTLSAEIEPGLPPVLHDAERVAQVVGNLVSNAVKFTHPGGEVCVRLQRGDGRSQRVVVTDTGVGFDPSLAQEVLTNGQHHRRPGTAGERSTGLGLSICRRIVDLHGGRIWATSTPGAGSEFSFELPECDAARPVSGVGIVAESVVAADPGA